jgi:hypothetical protein
MGAFDRPSSSPFDGTYGQQNARCRGQKKYEALMHLLIVEVFSEASSSPAQLDSKRYIDSIGFSYPKCHHGASIKNRVCTPACIARP